jgi:hypothetical protein
VLCIEVLHQNDGIYAEPDKDKTVIEVAYIARNDEQEIDINPKSIEHGFTIACIKQVMVLLPVTHARVSRAANKICGTVGRHG